MRLEIKEGNVSDIEHILKRLREIQKKIPFEDNMFLKTIEMFFLSALEDYKDKIKNEIK